MTPGERYATKMAKYRSATSTLCDWWRCVKCWIWQRQLQSSAKHFGCQDISDKKLLKHSQLLRKYKWPEFVKYFRKTKSEDAICLLLLRPGIWEWWAKENRQGNFDRLLMRWNSFLASMFVEASNDVFFNVGPSFNLVSACGCQQHVPSRCDGTSIAGKRFPLSSGFTNVQE